MNCLIFILFTALHACHLREVLSTQCKDPEPSDSRLVIIVDEIEHFSPVTTYFAAKEDVYYINRPFHHGDWSLEPYQELSPDHEPDLATVKPLEILKQFLYCDFTILKWKQELEILPEDLDLSNDLEFFLPRPEECGSVDGGLGGRWINFYWCVNVAKNHCKRKRLKVVRTTGLILDVILFLAKDPCLRDRINVIKFNRDPRASLNKLKWIAQDTDETLEKVSQTWCDRHLRDYTVMKYLEKRYPDMFLRIPYEAMLEEEESEFCFSTIFDYLQSEISFYNRDPFLQTFECHNATENYPSASDIAASIKYMTNSVYPEQEKDNLEILTKACAGFMYEVGYQFNSAINNNGTKRANILDQVRRMEEREWSVKATRNKYEEPGRKKFNSESSPSS